MKRVDLENHFYDQSLIRALEGRAQPPFYRPESDMITWSGAVQMPQGKLLPLLLDMGEGRLELMDRLGIDTAVISSSPGPEQLDPAESVEVCRKTNEALYRLTLAYPGRYLGSAILPVGDLAAAADELTRCVGEYGFVAWHTHSNYGASAPDEPRYRPLFRRAAELGVYVYLHPQLPELPRACDRGFSVAGPGLGFTLDTITTLTRLVISGLFDEIPDLKMVLGHLGEALPFLLDRMDNRLRFIPNPCLENRRAFSSYFKSNIYVTTSGNMSSAAFACAREVLGMDHILFGSDYPFEEAGDMVSFVEELPLGKNDRELLYVRNAREQLMLHV